MYLISMPNLLLESNVPSLFFVNLDIWLIYKAQNTRQKEKLWGQSNMIFHFRHWSKLCVFILPIHRPRVPFTYFHLELPWESRITAQATTEDRKSNLNVYALLLCCTFSPGRCKKTALTLKPQCRLPVLVQWHKLCCSSTRTGTHSKTTV